MKAFWSSNVFRVDYEMIESYEVFDVEAVRIYGNKHKNSPYASLKHGVE